MGHTSNEFQSAGQLEWLLLVEIRKIILHRGEIEVGPSRLTTFGLIWRDVPVTSVPVEETSNVTSIDESRSESSNWIVRQVCSILSPSTSSRLIPEM